MNSTTMQLARFIRKGPMPMARESLAIFQSTWNSFRDRGRCRKRSWLKKYRSVYASDMSWHRTVARAAPLMPMSSTKMKMGSRMALEITVNSVSPMASFGLPDDRTTELRPKYRCVTMLPRAMMTM